MKENSGKYRVLTYMQTHGSISGVEAIKNFSVIHLPAVIYKLKKEGYNIETMTESAKNQFGEKVHYARYYINEEEK